MTSKLHETAVIYNSQKCASKQQSAGNCALTLTQNYRYLNQIFPVSLIYEFLAVTNKRIWICVTSFGEIYIFIIRYSTPDSFPSIYNAQLTIF